MSQDSSFHGNFVWYELMTTAPQEALDFYGKLIGWTHMTDDVAGMPYTMVVNGERPIAGVMELPAEAIEAGAPSHWLGYVGVEDVDATVAKAEAAGSTVVVAAMDVPNVGRMAVLHDPQGAVVAVFRPEGDDMSAPAAPGAGDFSWHEMLADDWEKAWSFYSDWVGFEAGETMDMGEAGKYHMFHAGGRPLGGMYNKPAEVQGPSAWLYYVTVENLDDAVARVAELGGQVLVGPIEVPGGDHIAQCMDPQGAAFALHQVG
ncbi:MAG: VOC family protein [Acidobacteriota bacterium]